MPDVLLVDDDDIGARTLTAAFRLAGLSIHHATNGAQGIALGTRRQFDCAIIDLRLPDMRGIDVIRGLSAANCLIPFVLVSAFLTSRDTVEAMRLGAADVIEKPISADDLCVLALSIVDQRSDRTPKIVSVSPPWPLPAARARSAAERWAYLILAASEADGDLKTLADWARHVGLSYSSLRDACHVLAISSHESRDFARALRAALNADLHSCSPEAFLNIHDIRTMRAFLRRAGLWPVISLAHSRTDDFMERQEFVPTDHEAVKTLRRLLPQAPLWRRGFGIDNRK